MAEHRTPTPGIPHSIAPCEAGWWQPGDEPGAAPCQECTQAYEMWAPLSAICASIACVHVMWKLSRVIRSGKPPRPDVDFEYAQTLSFLRPSLPVCVV